MRILSKLKDFGTKIIKLNYYLFIKYKTETNTTTAYAANLCRICLINSMPIKIAPNHIQKLELNQVFVFGSNNEGRHGKGAALHARRFGAICGQSSGLQGSTYAIVTKDLNKGVRSIPLSQIKSQIEQLCDLAQNTQDKQYLLTAIGTSNAGYKVQEITNLLPSYIPKNIWLPQCFAYKHLSKNIMTVMFTGNRIQSFESNAERESAYSHLDKLIQRAIKRAIEWGYEAINFISGMALGIDTAACKYVLAQKCKNHSIKILLTAAIPCLNQDAKWRQSDKDKYKYLLYNCNFTQYVSNCNYSNAGGASCLDTRNKWMVSQLTGIHDMAISIHHGKAGGTQNCINDLSSAGKKTVIYNYRSNQYIRLGNW
ncbi:hypothetical protein CAL7716_101960 (plasmid) [Calothrix sp. PCC 7716]|nr:hypothetical protein CAL7716_101960 [Calothrix sp. PCC 7716]